MDSQTPDSHPEVTVKSWPFRAITTAHFFTTFIDNGFRLALVLLAYNFYTVANGYTAGTGALVASSAFALFLLPYGLFSLFAGRVADRYSKSMLFQVCLWSALPMTAVGLVGLWQMVQHPDATWPFLMVLTMLAGLGLQSAFLSPIRYGILPEVLKHNQLSRGNGNLEFSGYTGIFIGTICGWLILSGVTNPSVYWPALLILPGAALLSGLISFFVPKTPAADPQRSLAEGFSIQTFGQNWKIIRESGLIYSVMGLTIFWGVSTLVILIVPAYGDRFLWPSLEGYQRILNNNQLLIAISVGVGIGSWMAGRVSKGFIELGFVPIGAVLWGLSLIGLTFSTSYYPAMACLVLTGFAGGIFVVPLNAYLEKNSPAAHRASCIATSNVVTVGAMLVACASWALADALLKYPVRTMFAGTGIGLLVGAYYFYKYEAVYVLRIIAVLGTRLLYRLRILGQENIPNEGPALLVFNHMTFADGCLVNSCFSRFVRFVLFKSHYRSRLIKYVGEQGQFIPIDSDAEPREILKSLRLAAEMLNRGEVVCIFAEGALSRVGFMLPFQRGFELILKKVKNRDVPVIPGYIDGTWGSIFSFHGGKFFWKWPKQWPYPVTIKFGKPLPIDVDALEVRQKVQELSTECADDRARRLKPLHRQFVYNTRRSPRKLCMLDSQTPGVNRGQALLRMVVLRRLIERKLGPEKFVGLLIPPSVGGALANVALSSLGRVPVNLNYSIGSDVLNKCIEIADIKQIITSKKFMEKVQLEPKAEIIYLEDLKPDVQTSDKLFGLAARLLPAFITDRFLLGHGKHRADDLATIIFSSGSTGTPKGVMLTHKNVRSNIDALAQVGDMTPNDRIMGVLPFFHSFGYTATLWLPLIIDAPGIYHYTPLEAEVVCRMIRENQATLFMSTATFLRAYLRKAGPDDFKSVRMLPCGAEKLPTKLSDLFERKTGVRPVEGYGCTELTPVVAVNRPDVVDGDYRQVGNKEGTVGHPLPGVAARIYDVETDEILPPNHEGLLFIKGPNVMKGYLNEPEKTAAVIREGGWYNTGDLAKVDNDGFITITDRMSRFSKIGGEMVPHGQIEDTLHDILDAHADRMCAVVGVPDERKGERLVVLHKPLPYDLDELYNRLKERDLPALWMPAKRSFYEVEELPILGSGKLDLGSLKKIARERVEEVSSQSA